MKKYLLITLAVFAFQNIWAQTPVDRSKPPVAGPAPVLTLKDPSVYKMPNGITLLVVEDHRFPKVTATYSIDAGPVTEGSKAGVMNLMGGMLNEGTKKLPKAAFNEAVEKLGGYVSLSSGGGSASSLTRYFKSTFALMGQALREPAFTQESFDKLKSQALTNFKSEANSAKAIASRVNNALTYGKNHPSGEFETEESLKSITLSDVKTAYTKYITPSRAYLTIIGDIKPELAHILATEVLGSWTGTRLILPTLADVANPGRTEIDVVNMPDAVQAEIAVINLVSLKKNNPDYFPALLTNYILGGGAESRLFMDLREKRGFTYGAYSSLGSGRFQTTFEASASVRNAKADSAVAEFVSQIRQIRTTRVSDEELRIAKALYNGSFALGLEDPARTATFASNILINDLPADFYKTYLQKVNAVTADDILRVAQKYLIDQGTRIVVVGNLTQIPDSLKKAGYEVKFYDTYASPVSTAAKAAVTVSAQDIIKHYLTAVGGIDNLNEVRSSATTLNMAVNGMTLNVIQKKMVPDLELATMSMGGNVVFKTLFDGSTGYQEQMGNKKILSADEIAEKKSFTSLTEQIDYLKNKAFKLAVLGIQPVSGADAYQVSVTGPAGKKSTEYYDVKSGLQVKTETSVTKDATTVNTTIEYGDYRKVGKILLPYKQTMSVSSAAGQQHIEMMVTDAKINTGVSAADFK